MKTLIIYTSQTGFTKKYAEWLAGRTGGDVIELKEAKKKEDAFYGGYEAIVYGGWAMAGKLVKFDWFLGKSVNWKDKKLAAFCVGGGPRENPDVDTFLASALNDEQKKYIKLFYCLGGINYDKMSGPSKLLMKMFISSIKKNKNASEKERQMAETVSHSYDYSDIKYLDPVMEYLEGSVKLVS